MVEANSTRRPRVRRFTEAWLREQLGKVRPVREEWGDSDKPGLRARFGKSGTITWVHYRAAGGRQELLVLGRYPDLGLAAARDRLDEVRSQARQGLVGLEVTTPDADMTVEDLVDEFTASLEAHRKHPHKPRRALERFVLERPHGFRQLRARSVATPAWRAIVVEIAARGTPVEAANVFKLLGQMFAFGVQLGVLEASPFVGLRPRTLGAISSPPRQRALSVEELQTLLAIIAAPCKLDARTGRLALKILLLTGKRCGETLRARWDELDLEAGTWRIPGANRKGTKQAALGDELVPLSPAAVAAFQALKDLGRPGPWAFASPHSAASGRLADTAPSRIVRELFLAGALKGEEWTPHDLRRTARTCWASKLKIPWHVSELLLGHALPKIARTYDTGDYLEERRAALERWAAYLEQLAGAPGTLVMFPAAGGAR